MVRRVLLILVLVAGFAGVRAQTAHAATLVVDDDRVQCPAAAYTSIQAAVNAALAGDTIEVCPGTYTEQVSISGSAKNGLTLRSTSSGNATIKAPSTISSGDIVSVTDASNVTIRGFTIAGPLPDAVVCSGGLNAGIRVSGGSARIEGNRIVEIRSLSPGSRTCPNGYAIVTGGTVGALATITGNLLETYQRAGVYLYQTGTSATVSGNQITGVGATPQVGQIGIWVRLGATAQVTGNLVSNNQNATTDDSAGGIVLSDTPGAVSITGNQFVSNSNGVSIASGVTGATVRTNQALSSVLFGIVARALSANNTIEGNLASGSGDRDCRDQSSGSGTAGTANQWRFNVAGTAQPAGICLTVPGLSNIVLPPINIPTSSSSSSSSSSTCTTSPNSGTSTCTTLPSSLPLPNWTGGIGAIRRLLPGPIPPQP